MALDATIGGTSSDAYVTLAEATAYHAGLSNAAWSAATSAAQEAAIRKATIYLDSKYMWKGDRVTSTQALTWPRSGVYFDGYLIDSDVLPASLKKASYELALKALTTDLFADVEAQPVESVTVGPITRKLSAPRNGGQKRFAAVDAMVRDLVIGGSFVAVVRA